MISVKFAKYIFDFFKTCISKEYFESGWRVMLETYHGASIIVERN
jgi:hypothetical protein